jgi:hypothetical protein
VADFIDREIEVDDDGAEVVIIVVLIVPLVKVTITTLAEVEAVEVKVLLAEDAGTSTVLNVVALGTESRVVVDSGVLNRTLAMLEFETMLVVDVDTVEELFDELKVVSREVVVLAVRDAAPPPTTPPRTVESRACVVVVTLLVPVLALCDAVLRLAIARKEDCVVIAAADEMTPGVDTEASVATAVVDSDTEELEVVLEADTRTFVKTPPRLADVAADVLVPAAVVVVELAASAVLSPLITPPASAELLKETTVETKLADELDVCDAKIGRIVVTAPPTSDVTVARMVVLSIDAVVVRPVGTSETEADADADVDMLEAPRSRIVLTSWSVLVGCTGMDTNVLVGRMLSALTLIATELRAGIVVGSAEVTGAILMNVVGNAEVTGAILIIVVGESEPRTLDVNAPRSSIELEASRLGNTELGKTEVGKIVASSTSMIELGRTELGKIKGKLEVSTPRSRMDVGRIELARSELMGKLDVSTPRSKTELGKIELGRIEVKTPISTSVDVEAGTSPDSAAASTLSIDDVVGTGEVVVNGVVLLSTRQLSAGKLCITCVSPIIIIYTSLSCVLPPHLISTSHLISFHCNTYKIPTTLATTPPPEPAEDVALASTAATVVVGTEATVVVVPPPRRLLRRPTEPVNSPCETVSDRTLKAPTVRAPSVPVVTGAGVKRVAGRTEVADAPSRMLEMARVVVGRMSVTLATTSVTLEITAVTLPTTLETTAVGVSVTAGTLRVRVPGMMEEVATGRSERMLGTMLRTVGTMDSTVTDGNVTLGRIEVRPVTWLKMLEIAEVGISEVTMELIPDTTLGSAELRTEVTTGRTDVRGSCSDVVAGLVLAEATALETTELAAETIELISDVATGEMERVGSVGRISSEVLVEVGLGAWVVAEVATERADETSDETAERIEEIGNVGSTGIDSEILGALVELGSGAWAVAEVATETADETSDETAERIEEIGNVGSTGIDSEMLGAMLMEADADADSTTEAACEEVLKTEETLVEVGTGETVVRCVDTLVCAEDTTALLGADGTMILARLLLEGFTGALETFDTEGEAKTLEMMLDRVLWIGRALVLAIFVVVALALDVVTLVDDAAFDDFVEVLCTTGATLVLVI